MRALPKGNTGTSIWCSASSAAWSGSRPRGGGPQSVSAVGAGSGRPSEVSAYGGGTTGVIAFPVGNDRVYLIDPEAKVILVYAKAAKYATSLIGGRSYDLDIELVKRTEIELRQNGMPL